ncbi:hypothetical protein HAX54_023417, partial [Datura stramonium]|nr:hypothetical protein [Datura stramonium]
MGEENLEKTRFASTIQPPPIGENTNSNLTNTMLHLLSMKSLLGGLSHEDPNQNLKNISK